MKLAVVVQRYGAEVNGGAELHARYIAERLSSHAEVRVLTTCARDYVTWRDEYTPGVEQINGVAVERFRVDHPRDPLEFGRRSADVFLARHSFQQELNWIESEGPVSSALLRRLRDAGSEFDFVLLFSVRYHHAYHGARAVADRAILIPTAEREPAVALALFQPIFRGVRAIMYNSLEERAMIHALSHNRDTPGAVVGVGSEIPVDVQPQRARQRFGLARPFIVYVGRIDANKGCAELFEHFLAYAAKCASPLDLVLIGTPILSIPQHPRIRHLGFVSDQEKFDVIAAADALIMPSYFESLSMVALEAWALGRPVLVNGRCDVLRGQVLRSCAGLYYESAAEFAGAVDVLHGQTSVSEAMGRNGRAFYEEHYRWPVITRHYLDMFERLRVQPVARMMEAVPGFFERRRRVIPPAAEALAAVPAGPVLG